MFKCCLSVLAVIALSSTSVAQESVRAQHERHMRHTGGGGNYNSGGAAGSTGGGSDGFGMIVLGMMAIYAAEARAINDEIYGEPRHPQDAVHSRARHLAGNTVYLPELPTLWFDPSGYAVASDPGALERTTTFEWRVAGDRACLYPIAGASGTCLRFRFNEDTSVVSGIYLSSGELRDSLQIINLDIDNLTRFVPRPQ